MIFKIVDEIGGEDEMQKRKSPWSQALDPKRKNQTATNQGNVVKMIVSIIPIFKAQLKSCFLHEVFLNYSKLHGFCLYTDALAFSFAMYDIALDVVLGLEDWILGTTFYWVCSFHYTGN